MRLNEIFLYEILTQIKKVLVAGKVDLNLMVPCQNNYLNEKATFIHLAASSDLRICVMYARMHIIVSFVIVVLASSI